MKTTQQTETKTKAIMAVALVTLAIGATSMALTFMQKPSTVNIGSSHSCKGYCDSTVYTCIKKAGIDLMTNGASFNGEGSMSNGKPFSVSMGVKNNGTENAGPFTVKIWKSSDKIPGNVEQDTSGNEWDNPQDDVINVPDYLLATWDVAGLEAGGLINKTFENLSYTGFPIHKYYNYIIEVDAGNNVAELKEDNNLRIFQHFQAR